MKREFSRKEVESLLGIPVRRIQFYTDMELVKMKESNPGKGRGRKYTANNLFELLVVHELSEGCGVELARVKKVMKSTWKQEPEMLDLKSYSGNDPVGMYLMYSRKKDKWRFMYQRSPRQMKITRGNPVFEKLAEESRESFRRFIEKASGYPCPDLVRDDERIQMNMREMASAVVINFSFLADTIFELLGEKKE